MCPGVICHSPGTLAPRRSRCLNALQASHPANGVDGPMGCRIHVGKAFHDVNRSKQMMTWALCLMNNPTTCKQSAKLPTMTRTASLTCRKNLAGQQDPLAQIFLAGTIWRDNRIHWPRSHPSWRISPCAQLSSAPWPGQVGLKASPAPHTRPAVCGVRLIHRQHRLRW